MTVYNEKAVGKISYKNDNQYYGQILNFLPHGFGQKEDK